MAIYFSETDKAIEWSKIVPSDMDMLDQARETANLPFKITSHYRTPEKNASIGGASKSAHTKTPCRAFDIAYKDSHELFSILYGLMSAGFHRIGINPHNLHIHVDNEESLPKQVVWIEDPSRGKT